MSHVRSSLVYVIGKAWAERKIAHINSDVNNISCMTFDSRKIFGTLNVKSAVRKENVYEVNYWNGS